jgi:hypothetical protein
VGADVLAAMTLFVIGAGYFLIYYTGYGGIAVR